MMTRHTSSVRGFTFVEISVVLAVMTLGLGAAVSLFGTADGLVAESRANLRAVAENRAGLTSIATALRGVDLDTLGGFDVNGEATNPSFRRVVGSDRVGLVHAAAEELRWIATNDLAAGVDGPGAVYLVSGGTQHRLANRVVAGGFRVQQLGRSLVIRLRTYYTTSERRTIVVEGETAVSSRN